MNQKYIKNESKKHISCKCECKFDFDNILIDKKYYGNILVYKISYETLIGPKSFRIRLDKVDGFIRVYDRKRYLVLFGPEKYDNNRIRYLIS